MKEAIEKELEALISSPLFKVTRAANIECFHFGEELNVLDRRGNHQVVGKYVLNVQCAWRLAGQEGIIAASRDIYTPAGDPFKESPNFDWSQPGSTRCDERIQNFFQEQHNVPLIVEEIEADNIGSVTIRMKHGFRLEVFPDTSLKDEYWRFFESETENPHFVVTGLGIER